MSDGEKSFKIRFENVSLAEGGIKASRLREKLLDTSQDVQAEIEKDDPSTQDFGATLVLVLGAPAMVAIAKGIADYLRRDRGSISIEADGKIIAQGISGEDAARIAEAMSSKN
jgi:hypothetical protein